MTDFGAFEYPQSLPEANSAGQRSKKPSSLGPEDPPPPLKNTGSEHYVFIGTIHVIKPFQVPKAPQKQAPGAKSTR